MPHQLVRQLTYLESAQILREAYDRTYRLDTGIASIGMTEEEAPENGSLFTARLQEFDDLKISRFIPNFLDYIALPSFRIAEIKAVAKRLLDREQVESGNLANRINDWVENKKK